MNEEYLDFSKEESHIDSSNQAESTGSHKLKAEDDFDSWADDYYEPVNKVDIDYDSAEYESIRPNVQPKADEGDFLDELPDELFKRVMTRFDQIDYNIDSLFERIEAFQNLERLHELVAKQNARIAQLTEDMAFKASLPLYHMIIDYIDILADMLRRQDHLLDMGESLEQRYNTLFSAVEELQKYMSSGLENMHVEKFSDVDDDPLTRTDRQEVVERQTEENENEFLRYGEDVTTFYKTSSPGYVYRQLNLGENVSGLPAEHVVRPERVIKVVRESDSDY